MAVDWLRRFLCNVLPVTLHTLVGMNASDPSNRGGTAVTWEAHPWTRAEDMRAGASRRAWRDARGPYKAAISASIADLELRLPSGVLAEAEDAVSEIARFDSELSASLGEIEVAPLAVVLLRTESAASSEIEGITAGAKALAMASLNERSGPNALLVTANVDAMLRAIDLSNDLSADSILAAHEALLRGHAYANPGAFREEQVWIGGGGLSPHNAAFVPPHHSRVSAAIGDLMAYCDRNDVPVLVHAAVAHAQFETIHPFNDGNGRIGRVLVHAMLRRAGTTRRMTLPVSAGLLTDTSGYFADLSAYREGNPTAIVQRFTRASFAAISNGRLLTRDLHDIRQRWLHAVRARSDAVAWTVLPALIAQPAVSVKSVQDQTGVSHPAAQRAIDQLVDAGVLTPASSNRRNRVWLATEVTAALDAFAARAGRRGLV